jgi:hypothetical protein
VRDEVGAVEKAYRTPAGDLLFCATVALEERRVVHPYTICVANAFSSRQPVDCGYQGHLIELPRSVIKAGWPDEAMIRRQQLVSVPVRRVSSGLIVGEELDAWRKRLAVSDGEREAVYSVTGYGAGGYWQLLHVAHDEKSGTNDLRAFTIVQGHAHPEAYRMVYLPFSLFFDGCMIAGALYGYPICASALETCGERMGHAR